LLCNFENYIRYKEKNHLFILQESTKVSVVLVLLYIQVMRGLGEHE